MNDEQLTPGEIGSLIADLQGELTQAQATVDKLNARMNIFHRLIREHHDGKQKP